MLFQRWHQGCLWWFWWCNQCCKWPSQWLSHCHLLQLVVGRKGYHNLLLSYLLCYENSILQRWSMDHLDQQCHGGRTSFPPWRSRASTKGYSLNRCLCGQISHARGNQPKLRTRVFFSNTKLTVKVTWSTTLVMVILSRLNSLNLGKGPHAHVLPCELYYHDVFPVRPTWM